MKLALKSGVILLIAVVIIVGILNLSLNSMIKIGIQTMGRKMTGTPVTLQDVDLSLLSGQSHLKGLVVGNPEGFHTDHALKLGLVRVIVDPSSVFSDTLVIKEILIEQPEITLEGIFQVVTSIRYGNMLKPLHLQVKRGKRKSLAREEWKLIML